MIIWVYEDFFFIDHKSFKIESNELLINFTVFFMFSKNT